MPTELRANLRMSCMSESLLDGKIPNYDDFLVEAPADGRKIKTWFGEPVAKMGGLMAKILVAGRDRELIRL